MATEHGVNLLVGNKKKQNKWEIKICIFLETIPMPVILKPMNISQFICLNINSSLNRRNKETW
jgi:hypothetical protein